VSAILLKNVNKSYSDVHAVKDLNLTIEAGQLFGILGPNGAGKTTSIRMLLDIIKPDSGVIEIFGKPNSVQQRDNIGYLPEERGLFKKMRVRESILFFAEIKGVRDKKTALSRAENLLKRFELYDWKEKKIEELSRGMQQKLQFICTIIHEPRLLILDEPFTGLDPVNTNLLKDVILDLKDKGVTIIFSTHLMEQAEKLCESICLINKGRRVLNGTLSEIKRNFGGNRIRMRYQGNAAFLDDKSLVMSYDDYGQYVEIKPAQSVKPQMILTRALDEVAISLFEIADPSLNEIFISVVKD
jgi:ABC-2 type transport system ATP-binding protein